MNLRYPYLGEVHANAYADVCSRMLTYEPQVPLYRRGACERVCSSMLTYADV